MKLINHGIVDCYQVKPTTGKDKERDKNMYPLPRFLEHIVDQQKYNKWLQNRAEAHIKRDRRRGNKAAKAKYYKKAIHEAVMESNGIDAYTGEPLAWKLLGNQERTALKPTVDHVEYGKAKFKICAWRTNDAKTDLSPEEFVEFCRKVVKRDNELHSRKQEAT